MSAVEERATEWSGTGLDKRGSYLLLRVDEITVSKNIRKAFDEGQLAELAASLKEYGVLQPLVVRILEGEIGPKYGPAYELVAGERRLRAAKIAGLEKVPCRVVSLTAKQAAEVQLLENLQRQDLNPVEEAEALAGLLTEHGYTQEELARKLGKSQPWVASRTRLLDLPEPLLQGITRGIINASAAEVLAHYTKVAPDVAVKIVERMKYKPIPVAKIRDEVDFMVAQKCKRLDAKNDWAKPAFDPSPCIVGCPKVLYLREYGSKQESPRCSDEACWEAKNKAAKEAALQHAMEVAGPGSILYSALGPNQYRRIYAEDGLACPADCEHRKHTVKPGYGEGPEEMDVCLKPDCHHRRLENLMNARVRAAADAQKAKAQEYIDAYRATNFMSHLTTLPRHLLVSIGLQLLLSLLPSEDGPGRANLAKRLGLGGQLASWRLRSDYYVALARHLDSMPAYQLIDILMETLIQRRVEHREFEILDYLIGKPLPEPQPEDGDVA